MEPIEIYKKKLEELLYITLSKNYDYAGSEKFFANFELAEELGICKTEEAFLVRMSDKFSRICRLIKKDAKVKDETIQDTLIDLANYSILLSCYLDQKKNSEVKNNGRKS